MKKTTSEPQAAGLIAQLDALDALADDQIDYSDAPALADWSDAVRGRYFNPEVVVARPRRVAMPEPVAAMFEAIKVLEQKYPRRKFTLDGHLAGSIGEVIAAEALNLELHPGTDTDDAGADVQIKLTDGRAIAMHGPSQRLVVMRVVSPQEAEIVYDGPGQPAWDEASKPGKDGQRVVSLARLRKFAATNAPRPRCPRF